MMAGLVMLHLTLSGCDYVQMINAEEISKEEMEGTFLLQEKEEIIEFEENIEEEITKEEITKEESGALEGFREEVIERVEEEEKEGGNPDGDEAVEDITEMETEVFSDIIVKEFSEETEQTEAIGYADFSLSVTEDISSVRAGDSIGYEIYLENTGNVDLENLIIRSFFDNGNLNGEWQNAEGVTVNQENGTAILSSLEAGASRTLVVLVNTTEERQEAILGEFLVKTVNPLNEEEILNHSATIMTEIIPLKVEFSVSKWANRSVALPGDTVLYQICIRNTGERTLHSVLTTEKFVNAGVSAQFQEKEGVILNGSKTQALISEIKPGEAFGLNALVTIPENMESGELLNEVIVMTAETGEQKFTAQAEVEILENAVTDIPKETAETTAAYEVSDIPKTEDLSETEFWAGAFGVACLIVIAIYWIQKAKRKH